MRLQLSYYAQVHSETTEGLYYDVQVGKVSSCTCPSHARLLLEARKYADYAVMDCKHIVSFRSSLTATESGMAGLDITDGVLSRKTRTITTIEIVSSDG